MSQTAQRNQASIKAKTAMGAGLILCFFIMGLGVVSHTVGLTITGLIAAMIVTVISVAYTKQVQQDTETYR